MLPDQAGTPEHADDGVDVLVGVFVTVGGTGVLVRVGVLDAVSVNVLVAVGDAIGVIELVAVGDTVDVKLAVAVLVAVGGTTVLVKVGVKL